MAAVASLTRNNRPLAASLALLVFALWLRLTHLTSLPVFVDEGTHLYWAQLFTTGQATYPFYMDGRLLAVAYFALFDLGGPTPLWLGRAAAAVLATLNVAACITLGRRLGDWRTGWLAGLLYAVLPFAVFHDRQMLADTVSAAGGALMLVGALRLAGPGRWRNVWPFGLGLAAAVLAKLNAVLYLGVPVLAVLLLAETGAARRRLAARYAVGLALAAGSAALFLFVMRDRLGTPGGVMVAQELSPVQCPPALCQGDLAEQWRRLPGALASLLAIVAPHFGWPLVAAALAALPVPGRRRREAWLYGALIVLMLAALVASVREFIFPRYVIYVAAPLAVLAAHAVLAGPHWAPADLRPALRIGLLLVVAWPLTNSVALITRPLEASLPPIDERQYVTGVYTGAGFAEAARVVADFRPADFRPADNHPLLVLGTAWHRLPLSAYLEAALVEMQAAADLDWPTVEAALAAGRPLFLLEEYPRDSALRDPTSADVAFLARPGTAAALRLRRYAGLSADAQAALFAALFIRPDAFLDTYDQLLAEAAADGATLIPYPPQQTAFLLERPGANAARVLAVGGARPWDPDEALQRLATADVLAAQQARAVFLQETRLDPQRRVEAWLAQHLFHLGERWFGPVRVVDYAGPAAGPAALSFTPDLDFGGLELAAVDVLDAAPSAGGRLRLRLTWRCQTPTPVAYKVFVHVFQGERLAAQHDGQPVGELRPTTTWRAGDVIVDQLALALPADLAPGDYQLRIGLYDLATQQRLPAQTTAGQPAEFFVSPALTVK